MKYDDATIRMRHCIDIHSKTDRLKQPFSSLHRVLKGLRAHDRSRRLVSDSQ